MCIKSEQELRQMSAAVATGYVRRMAEMETKGFGDDDNALRRLEARFGLSFWTLKYLKHGRAATVDADLFSRLRGAYLSYCEQKITTIQHELATERAIGAYDDDLADLEAAATELAAKIARAKAARLSSGRGRR
jgi:hypothetical protein